MLVASTKADKVMPALEEVYNVFGNPNIYMYILNNGPPFNSRKMKEFTESREIESRDVPPLHPYANPAETVMKPNWKSHEDKPS